MKGSCKSLVDLEYFLEEIYKATIDQLDWNKPEGQQYPHDMRKPLPLIPNLRGRRVIPFDHFINNDLVYLSGGISSRTYATLVTKTKAADYGHIKWIEDLVPKTMWNDYKLYTFKEGDYNRLRLQYIEDMLIIIRRRVKDLQLGIESYQKKLNLIKPDTYRSDLKQKTPYTAYSNPKGFIYQNKDKKNILMCIDELHKFSDGTLNDVRSALDDILKRIRMEYLPQIVWRNVDRERAGAMIQAIDRQLRNRRLMRSLEKFVVLKDCDGIAKRPTMYINLWSYKVVRNRYSNPMIQPELEGSTQGYPLVSVEVLRFDTSAGNPVKEILLKLNLPDHMSILTDSKIYIKLVMEVPGSS
ncbi:hypothetical protein Tco_0777924 [Tanacetum coccineum]